MSRNAWRGPALLAAIALLWAAGSEASGVGRYQEIEGEELRVPPWMERWQGAGPFPLPSAAPPQIPTSDNVQVLGNVPLCLVDFCADVWGHAGLAIVAKRGAGWGLVDADDPFHPREIAAVSDGLFVQDVKLSEDGRLAVVSNEDLSIGAGAVLYDITNPFAPWELSRLTEPRARSVHNVFLADGFLYLASNITSEVEIYDVRIPSDPVHVASIADPNGRIHDAVVVGGLLYSSFLGGGFTVHDVSDPHAPLLLASHDYPGAFTHNAWPSADGRFLFTTDEIAPDGHMRVWDLGEAGGGTGPVRQVGRYATVSPAVIHNVHTLGDLVYIAYYSAGLRIVDVSEPRLPVEVGYAETSARQEPIFRGTWGVFPYTGRDHVFVSDMDSGTWVVRFTGEISPGPTGLTAQVAEERGALVARSVFQLAWDPHPLAAGYQVYRSDDQGVLERAARTGPGETSYTELGPLGESRSYAVTALLADGTESRPTPIVAVGGGQ